MRPLSAGTNDFGFAWSASRLGCTPAGSAVLVAEAPNVVKRCGISWAAGGAGCTLDILYVRVLVGGVDGGRLGGLLSALRDRG